MDDIDLASTPNVDLLDVNGKQVVLVGTAHVSRASAELAEQVIRQVKPASVAVELCYSRYSSLKDPDRWKNTDIVKVIRSGKAYVLLGQLILGSFQKRIGEQLGIKPGEEMMRAVKAAEDTGAEVVLADREIATTLRRTWGRMGIFSTFKVMGAMLGSMFSKEEISEEEIERLKSSDVLEEAVKELSGALPEVRATLIDERDQYLAAKIQDANGPTIVAIVGAGHVPGIRKYLGTPLDLEPLETLPPPRLWTRVLGWAIPALIVALIAGIFWHWGSLAGLKALGTWALVTGIAGALGAVIALAHPLTILASFVAAPIAALHPLIATGWVAALVEAWVRKPRVSDFETLADEIGTLRGLYSNRVSRVLLVMVLTNLAVMISQSVFLGGALTQLR